MHGGRREGGANRERFRGSRPLAKSEREIERGRERETGRDKGIMREREREGEEQEGTYEAAGEGVVAAGGLSLPFLGLLLQCTRREQQPDSVVVVVVVVVVVSLCLLQKHPHLRRPDSPLQLVGASPERPRAAATAATASSSSSCQHLAPVLSLESVHSSAEALQLFRRIDRWAGDFRPNCSGV